MTIELSQHHAPCGCPNKVHMGEFACVDPTQCWEPCGELGKSGEHTVAVPVSVVMEAERTRQGRHE